jgi:drug/metabolite transporter (DMT)-like permease
VTGTFTLLLYRFIMVMLFVAVIITVRREWRPPDRDTLLVGFFANFVWLVAILKAFEFGLNAGLAALIAALQPALTALVSPFLLGEANDRVRWCGIGVGFAGVLVFVAGDMQLFGTPLWVYGLPLLATMCLTFVKVGGRRASKADGRNIPLMTVLFWLALLATICLAPLAWWFDGFASVRGGQLFFQQYGWPFRCPLVPMVWYFI